MDISALKEIYESYGYEYKNIDSVDVFEFKHSRYFGADILYTKKNEDAAKKICEDYKNDDFATSLKEDPSIEIVENELFDGFFKIKHFQNRINQNYDAFAQQQIDGFKDVNYQYVHGVFNRKSFNADGYLIDEEFSCVNVVDTIVSLINQIGSKLIILEAAAGYGKTCTANEIVHQLCSNANESVPLHIEISNNREARIFKHILQNEIEDQFKNAVTSKSVLRQVFRGRIPVIIDGFDELLSKDCDSSLEKNRDVESMLNTIITLLQNNAKVVITSRKTAFFSGEDFFKWIQMSDNVFETHRITIAEPNIEDWLAKEKIDYFISNDFPLENVANPVLLSYLRYSSLESLKEEFETSNNLIEHYITFLLKRENLRQKIKWGRDEQLKILEKLARFMCELRFKAESKNVIKEIIAEYNTKRFNDFIEKCDLIPKPTQEDLAETLSNHALLDRKKDGNIGFINDFILGYLIGKNIVERKFHKHYPKTYSTVVNQDFGLLAVNAFRFESDEEREKLYDILIDPAFTFDNEFQFFRDLYLKRKFGNEVFEELTIEQTNFNNIRFECTEDNLIHFSKIIFDSCTFKNCSFSRKAFSHSYVANCNFINCSWFDSASAESNGNLTISCSTCDNDFIDLVYFVDNEKEPDKINYEEFILGSFCKADKVKPMCKLDDVYKSFEINERKNIDKSLNQLRIKKFITIDGNHIFIHKDGISFYNRVYRTGSSK